MNRDRDNVEAILARNKAQYEQFKDGGDLMLLEPLYTELYEYFAGSGEMPYGIQKARDGDPDTWIARRLEALYL